MLLLPACDRKENIKSSSDDTQGIIDGNASGETYENKWMFSGISVIIGGKKLMVGGKCR